jgi:carboxypeptidase D
MKSSLVKVRCWRILLLSLPGMMEAIRILPRSTTNSSPRRSRQTSTTPPAVHVPVPSSPDDHLVDSLPLLDDASFTTKHWAGHLPAVGHSGDKYFFYWLFAPETSHDSTDIPLIIWLNGGPACSSMDGLFIENGPFRFDVDKNTGKYVLVPNPYSWHKTPAYTLYIDQPVGTGLSFTTSGMYPTNDREVNVDFYYFLQQFFSLHGNKFVLDGKVSRKVFFSGESYAGHYIPSIMNYLLKENDRITSSSSSKDIIIPLAGAAIGNGWTDPFYQYAGAEFAYGHGLIGASEVLAFQAKEKLCQAQLNRGIYNVGLCFDLIDDILSNTHGAGSDYHASGYDVRVSEKKHGDREFPPGHKIVETYLGGWELPSNAAGTLSPSLYSHVLGAIHASAATTAGQTYQECTDPPYNALSGNDGKGVVDDVMDILKHPDGVQLLFFNGIHDIICNHVGNEKFLQMLPWENAAEWYQSARYAWAAGSETPGQVSGYMKEFQNLKFLKILDAGHMVPMDVPSVSLDMMKLFTSNGSFDAHKQMLEAGKEDSGSCPTCPTCLERDSGLVPATSQSQTGNGEDNRLGSFAISFAWLVAGATLASFACFVSMATKRRQLRPTIPTHIPVPQYELELRESSYHDNAENGTARTIS